MSTFEMYLRLGFQHIINIHGYDHIIFVLVLCAAYSAKEITRVLILVTAFTIGHSLTLALSTLNILSIPSRYVEFMIPATILITALSNVLPSRRGNLRIVFVTTLFFGLIHGLGFSNYLKGLLGKESNILTPLFAFNVGIETGQIVILCLYFLLYLLTVNLMKVRHDFWRLYISGAGFGIALILLIENKFW
ncbi:HupE/UreJ family protein [Maribellus sp. YY47]|uniref:HupE/UreJ family protein n=1 Tax=Maribellus sp. YY47 TaxID=2929486 RepID=UPI00200158AF|nr:HupE/UreJ family protein [Maribellus sp. YY47]MCK3683438.1 HupE/UreJ family protein [Maribellus sp. YY47]